MNTNLQRVLIIGIPIIVIGIGFGAYKLIESYRQTQQLIASQQQSLTTAQQEIKSLAANASSSDASTRNEIAQAQMIAEKAQASATQSSDSTSIRSSDIAPYLSGILQIVCGGAAAGDTVSGSASLWDIPSGGVGVYQGYSVLTNFHVVQTAILFGRGPDCTLYPDRNFLSPPGLLDAYIKIADLFQWNQSADAALFPVAGVLGTGGMTKISGTSGYLLASTLTSSLNYSISSLPKCSTKMPLGSPVVTAGFPAFGMQNESTNGFNYTQSALITSYGTIGGYANSADPATPLAGNLPYMNYFVSAKIDSGNSGGIAFSKNVNGLCVLGIPTWINTGSYANEGIVQNINNVMYGNLP